MHMELAICIGVTAILSCPMPMVAIEQEFQERLYSLSYEAVSGILPPSSLGRSKPTRCPSPKAFTYSFHFINPLRVLCSAGLSSVSRKVLQKNELHECAMARRRLAACPGTFSSQRMR